MAQSLTVADLLGPGMPLEAADVLAGEPQLDSPVTWAASLRPYMPAIPRLKGGEIVLAGMDIIERIEPPTGLAEVVRQVVSLGASGLAVRGQVDDAAQLAAREAGLPLVRITGEAALHDIEQAIMRECAMFQARREVQTPAVPGSWLDQILSGRVTTATEVSELARSQGYSPTAQYAVAFGAFMEGSADGKWDLSEIAQALNKQERSAEQPLIARPAERGLAVLLPAGREGSLSEALPMGLQRVGWGVGRERTLMEALTSLEEARLAALASGLLHGGQVVRYAEMGVERLLVLLYRDNRAALEDFVNETVGRLIEHDDRSATLLMKTVEAFVEHGGRLRETATEMYVHRNTLAYRLERASEILEADLKDPETRLAVELALRSLPLVKHPPKAGGR
jgi:hypothetical protein